MICCSFPAKDGSLKKGKKGNKEGRGKGGGKRPPIPLY